MRQERSTAGRLVALATLLLTLACALAASTGLASAASNPWLGMRVLNQAHQGGEDVNPSNTMYAYADSLASGSDMLELDVSSTKDHRVIVMHDDTVDRTTDGTGPIDEMTLAQIRRLDAGYWFAPGHGTVHGLDPSAYPFRGIRTGERRPPRGYEADDFAVPTLRKVLNAYPQIPINVEIKGVDEAEKFRVADDLARVMGHYPNRADDVIVVSFDQKAIDRFHAKAPDVSIAAGTTAVTAFLLADQPLPEDTDAIQIPYSYDVNGNEIPLAQEALTQKAHDAGVAVHYWEVPETRAAYQQVLSVCGDGIMTTRPARFEHELERSGAPRIGGQGRSDACPNPPAKPPRGCRLDPLLVIPPRHRRAAVRFERWGDLRGDCAGRIRLRTARPMHPLGGDGKHDWRRPKRHLGLGSGKLPVSAGRSGTTAMVHLDRTARRLLARHSRLRVRISAKGRSWKALLKAD